MPEPKYDFFKLPKSLYEQRGENIKTKTTKNNKADLWNTDFNLIQREKIIKKNTADR